MENATKALLIAAAVLIAILIISLGIVVYNKASEAMGSIDMNEYQIQQFNDKFKKYEGINVSGSEVNAMLETVFNHNNSQEDSSTCVAVTGASTLSAQTGLTTSATKVSIGSRYTVTLTYNDKTGLVTSIAVAINK